MKYKLIILLAISLIIARVPGTWETFGDANYANCTVGFDDVLYVGTRGGIIKYIPGQPSEDWEIMTNVHGLGGLDVCGLIEYEGDLYYAASNGALGRLKGDSWEIFPDLLRDNVGINDITVGGDYLYVATIQGVSKLRPLYGNQVLEVAENFNKISELDRNYPVNAVSAGDSILWLATDIGLAYGALDGNLFVPEAWSIDSTNRAVIDVFADSGGVWFVLDDADDVPVIFYFDGEVVDTVEDSFMLSRRLDGIFYYDGELYAHGHDGLFKMAAPDDFVRVRLDEHWAIHGGSAVGDSLYLAMEIGFGVLRQDTVRHRTVNSPSGEAFKDIAIAPNGDVLVVSNAQGACVYSDGEWENITAKYMPYDYDDSVYSQVRSNIHHVYRCAYDGNGNIWLGMTGDGVFRYSETGGWDIFDKTNSILDGYSANPDAPLCWGLDYDETRDLMWISNYDNLSGLSAAAFNPGDDLTSPIAEYYTGTASMPNNYVMSLTASGGDIWLVLRDEGVTLIDPGYDIYSYSDDFVHNYSDGLPGAMANRVAVDSEGISWVAVSGGVVSIEPYLGLVTEQVLPEHLSTFVSGVSVDDDDNVWVSTDNGAGVFRRADSTWIAIRTEFAQDVYDYERTDLAVELLYATAYNPVTGDVWFCGENAISVFHIGSVFDQGQELLVYPNPYIWDGFAGNYVRIAQIPSDAEVYIYSPDGSLVRTIETDERVSLAYAEWDGRNEAGEAVASGVYVVVANNGEVVSRGKVALIRSD